MTTFDDKRLGAAILLGAVLATVANALHPFIAADATSAEFLGHVERASYWDALHVAIVVSAVLLIGGIVAVFAQAVGGAADGQARVAIALAIVGGTIFTFQIGAVDGAAFPALGDALADGADPAVVAVVAAAFQAFDLAMLGIVVAVFFGATFLMGASALAAIGRYPAWSVTLARVTGWAGVIVGLMMLLGIADGVTFYLFRVVALAVTVVAFVLGATHYRAGPKGSSPIHGGATT